MTNATPYKAILLSDDINDNPRKYAFIPTNTLDHAFVMFFAGEKPTGELTIAQIVGLWSKVVARNESGVFRYGRALHFFDEPSSASDPVNTIATALKDLYENDWELSWDYIQYWKGQIASDQDVGYTFPYDDASTNQRIIAGDIAIAVTNSRTLLESLRNFQLDTTDDGDITLTFSPRNSITSIWTVDNSAATADLTVMLAPRDGYRSGAIGIAISQSDPILTPTQFDGSTFLKRLAIVYQGGETGTHQYQSLWARSMVPASSAFNVKVFLDPRDGQAMQNNILPNSSVCINEADIASNFMTPNANRIQLTNTKMPATQSRVAFLTTASITHAIFPPQGTYAIVKAGSSADSTRMLCGSSPTEFVDIGNVNFIRFEPNQAAQLLPICLQKPVEGQQLLGPDAKTSYLALTATPDGNCNAPYYCQTSEALLFTLGKNASDSQPVLKNTPVSQGSISVAFPVVPWAGYLNEERGERQFNAFDAANLNRKRMALVQVSAAGLHARVSAAPAYAATPQGMLALVSGSTYRQLFFGKADDSSDDAEFSIKINPPSADADAGSIALFNGFQAALNSSQFVLVVNSPTPEAQELLTTSQNLGFCGFNASLPPAENPSSVLIVKYSTNQSLAQLASSADNWACPYAFAPTPAATIALLALVNPNTVDIWNDRNWQGILLLNLGITMPDELEVLSMFVPHQSWQMSYLGLNALPVSASDLNLSATVAPNRVGSMFGKIDIQLNANATPTAPGTSVTVKNITVVFSNSQVTQFDSTIALNTDCIFLEPTKDLTLTLAGKWNSRPNSTGKQIGVFDFELAGPTLDFNFTNTQCCLKTFTVSSVQLLAQGSSEGFIAIDGNLQFNTNFEKIAGLTGNDTLEVGSIGWYFEKTNTGAVQFTFNSDNITSNLTLSAAVASPSLLQGLPIRLKGMVASLDTAIPFSSNGYIPLMSGQADAYNFALIFELNLGYLGKLSANGAAYTVPFILGWTTAGSGAGQMSVGIQLPNGSIDIGIEQFVQFKAKELDCKRLDSGATHGIVIKLIDATMTLFGSAYPPNSQLSLLYFISDTAGKKPCWAFSIGSKDGGGALYVAAGYGFDFNPNYPIKDVDSAIIAFKNSLGDTTDANADTAIENITPNGNDGWNVVASTSLLPIFGTVGLAVIDANSLYSLKLPFLGELTYSRVTDKLGKFTFDSVPLAGLSDFNLVVLSLHPPKIEVDVYTDGGFEIWIGKWSNNDFSGLVRAEITIFIGGGGLHFGLTDASAVNALTFNEFDKWSPIAPTGMQCLQLGVAIQVGVGKSLEFGCLSASANISIVGGIEGVAAWQGEINSANLTHPNLYAVTGFVGIVVTGEATVDFAVITASAAISAYAIVGITLAQVEAQHDNGPARIVQLPLEVSVDIGIRVTAEIVVHIGCSTITLPLSFSTDWYYYDRLTDLVDLGPAPALAQSKSGAAQPRLQNGGLTWDPEYLYGPEGSHLVLFGTVVTSMMSAQDAGSGSNVPCAVGMMLIPTNCLSTGFLALLQFLVGWALLPNCAKGTPKWETGNFDDCAIANATAKSILDSLKSSKDDSDTYNAFCKALLPVITKQFSPVLKNMPTSDQDSRPVCAFPFWPDTKFAAITDGKTEASMSPMRMLASPSGYDTGKQLFIDACYALLKSTLSLIVKQQCVNVGDPNAKWSDPNSTFTWADAWKSMPGSIDSIAQDFSRTLFHGSRVMPDPEVGNKYVGAMLAAGQQIPVATAPATSIGFSITVNGANLNIPSIDAAVAKDRVTAMQTVLGAPQTYLTLTPSAILPRWHYHQKEFSFASQGGQDRQVDVLSPDGKSKTSFMCLPSAALMEMGGIDSPAYLTLKPNGGDRTIVDPANWMPAILIQFPLTMLDANNGIYAIGSAAQGARYYLNQLVQRALSSGANGIVDTTLVLAITSTAANSAAGMLQGSREVGAKGAASNTASLTDWVIMRDNLTTASRAGAAAHARAARRDLSTVPDIATYLDDDRGLGAVALLQQGSATNSGGYYLRTGAKLDSGANGSYCLMLCVRLGALSGLDTSGSKVPNNGLPLESNAIAYRYPNVSDAPLPQTIALLGDSHVRIVPAVAPEDVCFVWERQHGSSSDGLVEEYAYSSLTIVEYEVRDASGATIRQRDLAGLSPTGEPTSDLDDQQRHSAKILADSGKKAAGKRLAAIRLTPRHVIEATHGKKAWKKRISSGTFYYTGCYNWYKDTRQTSTQIAQDPNCYGAITDANLKSFSAIAGFRDLYGNQVYTDSSSQLSVNTIYTDVLLNPSEWPGITFAVSPGASSNEAGHASIKLTATYSPMNWVPVKDQQPGAIEQQAAMRKARLLRAIDQLKGVGNDVGVSVAADGLTIAGDIAANPNDNALKLRDWLIDIYMNAGAQESDNGKTYTLPSIDLSLHSEGPIEFTPRLVVSRTDARYGPSDSDLSNVAPDIASQIRQQVMSAALNPVLVGTKIGENTIFKDVAKAFSSCLADALQVSVAYSSDRFGSNTLWLIPKSCMPAAGIGAPTFASPRPIQTSLVSEKVFLPDGTSTTIVDADLDEYCHIALSYIEQVCSDLPLMTDAGGRKNANALLSAKRAIANVLSSYARSPDFIVPFYSDMAVAPQDAHSIAAVSSDAFLQDLRNFYALGTLVQLPLTRPNSAFVTMQGKSCPGFAKKTPLKPTLSDPLIDFNETAVTLMYDLPRGASASTDVDSLQNITVEISGIQLSSQYITAFGAADGANNGPWLKLVSPWPLTWTIATPQIPVAIRQFPDPPSIRSVQTASSLRCTGLPLALGAADIKGFVGWNWSAQIDVGKPRLNPNLYINANYDVAPLAPSTPMLALAGKGNSASGDLLECLAAFRYYRDNNVNPIPLVNIASLATALANFLNPKSALRTPSIEKSDAIIIGVDANTATKKSVSGKIFASADIDVKSAASQGQTDRMEVDILATTGAGGNPGAYFVGNLHVQSVFLDAFIRINDVPGINSRLLYESAHTSTTKPTLAANRYGPPNYPLSTTLAAPIIYRYSADETLGAALPAFFDSLLGGKDVNDAGVRLQVEASLHWTSGSMSVDKKFVIIPHDLVPAINSATSLAKIILDMLKDELDGQIAVGNRIDVRELSLRLSVRMDIQSPTLKDTAYRTVLDIAAIDFAVV